MFRCFFLYQYLGFFSVLGMLEKFVGLTRFVSTSASIVNLQILSWEIRYRSIFFGRAKKCVETKSWDLEMSRIEKQ